MSRLLLGTTLIATQILTGFGYGRALCLRSDGSVCCIHTIAGKCGCCEHGHGEKECSHEHDSGCDLVCCIAGNHATDCHEEPTEVFSEHLDSVEQPLMPCEPCGCRHLPISSGPVSVSQKSEQITASHKTCASEYGIVRDHLRMSMRRDFQLNCCDPNWSPHCLSVGLTIVSSTVIRC